VLDRLHVLPLDLLLVLEDQLFVGCWGLLYLFWVTAEEFNIFDFALLLQLLLEVNLQVGDFLFHRRVPVVLDLVVCTTLQ